MNTRKHISLGKNHLLKLAIAIVVLALAWIFYFFANDYALTVANSAIIYFFCSVTVVLLLGLCGQLSFVSVSFMGLGAFFAGQLAKNFDINPLLAIPLAIFLTTILAFFLGFLLLRLKGPFFIFGTMALVNIFQTIFQNFRPLSGGPDGLYGIPKLELFGITFDTYRKWFWVLLFCAFLVAVFVKRIRDTSLGRSMMAVRDNEIAAQGMGVNIKQTKLIAFVLSAAIAAFGGALLCFHNGVVSSTLFTFSVQMRFLTMAMLGGINSIIGTAFGTAVVVCLPEFFRVLERYMTLFYGVGTILMMIFMPTGIAGLAKKYIGGALRTLNARKEAQADAGIKS